MKLDKFRNLPVYKKAEEIFELAQAIAEALKEGDQREFLASEILLHASIMQVKIAGAEGGRLYSLRMQNAVLIKLAAHDLRNAVTFAELIDINEEDYVELMRDKIEEFRIVFNEWIRGFDKTLDAPDNWAIRFDTSTPEQEKLEELMFDDDRFFDEFDDDDFEEDGEDKE